MLSICVIKRPQCSLIRKCPRRANLWHSARVRCRPRPSSNLIPNCSSRAVCAFFLNQSECIQASFARQVSSSSADELLSHSCRYKVGPTTTTKGSAAKWRTVNTQHNIRHTHTHTDWLHSHTHRERATATHKHTYTGAAGRNNISQLSKLSIKYFRIFYQKRKWLAMPAEAEALTLLSLRVSKASFHYSYSCCHHHRRSLQLAGSSSCSVLGSAVPFSMSLL